MCRASSRGRPRIFMLPYRGIEISRPVTGTKRRRKFVVADGTQSALQYQLFNAAVRALNRQNTVQKHSRKKPAANRQPSIHLQNGWETYRQTKHFTQAQNMYRRGMLILSREFPVTLCNVMLSEPRPQERPQEEIADCLKS